MVNKKQILSANNLSINARKQVETFLNELVFALKRSTAINGLLPSLSSEVKDIPDPTEFTTPVFIFPSVPKQEQEKLEESKYDFDDPDQTFALIDNARNALKAGRSEELIEVLTPLLEIAWKIEVIDTGDLSDILEWANSINAKEIELLYEPRDSRILIPKLIVEAKEVLIELIGKNSYELYNLTSDEFEGIIAEMFSRFGYQTELTRRTRDGGKDIIAISKKMGIHNKIIIECKKYERERKVGLSYVQRLLGVKIANRANKALLVTSSVFTRPAKDFEKQHFWDLELKDYNDVLKWVNEYMRMK